MVDSPAASSWSSPDDTDTKTQLQSDLLDPSDPLNLILNMSASCDSSMEDSSSSSHGSPPDWSDLSALWSSAASDDTGATGENMKFAQDLNMDFNFSFPMDLDFNPASSIDPSALQFNYSGVPPMSFSGLSSGEGTFIPPHELLNVPFLNQQQCSTADANLFEFSNNGNGAGTTNRRLSITSSSSSSGASLSPILEPAAPAAPAELTPAAPMDPTEELANKVRQAAGVTLAVPVSSQMQQAMVSAAQAPQPKLPIPRLPRPASASKSKRPSKSGSGSSSASTSRSSTSSPPPSSLASPTSLPSPAIPLPPASLPPPTTQFPLLSALSSSQSAPSTQPQPQSTQTATTGRGKTSHTTIERRYRTNLNARIQSLRRAVPALRVLEQKEGKADFGDIVDERGFVDGVRVARKTSKASILGKAVEYIRVLKKREGRLKREQDGLRCLICGLVGGPALLKEWEREWKERFGGAEKDEVEGDEEESDDDDSDEDEEGGRAKKRVKVAKPAPKREKKVTASVVKDEAKGEESAAAGMVPEKRKRGRPRKVTAPPAAPAECVYSGEIPIAPAPATMMEGIVQKTEEQTQQVSPAPQSQPQYLLAAFAFFSFFNSPLTSSSSAPSQHHAHTGSVLSSTPMHHAEHVGGTGIVWRDIVQMFHLLVSALVFLSIVIPWLPGAIRMSRVSKLLGAPFSVHGLRSSSSTSTSTTHASSSERPASAQPRRRERSVSKSGLNAALVAALSHANRGTPGEAAKVREALGVYDGVLGLVQGVVAGRRKGCSWEARQAEQRAWGRLGELVVLDGTTSVSTRLQTYWCMRLRTPYFKASASDLCTLALIVYPVFKATAEGIWERAKGADFGRPYERMVVESLGVEEASERLAKQRTTGREYWASSPLRVLAESLICERLRRDAAGLFVETVLKRGQGRVPGIDGEEEEKGLWMDPEEEEVMEKERRKTIDAGKSLGGVTADLAECLERIWETGYCPPEVFDVYPPPSSSSSSADLNLQTEVLPLIRALVLYRQIFPSCLAGQAGEGSISLILSPPPSPTRKGGELHRALRDCLGEGVFEGSWAGEKEEVLGSLVEDARDRVVDMIVESERARRGY